jgi:hypothetical protein
MRSLECPPIEEFGDFYSFFIGSIAILTCLMRLLTSSSKRAEFGAGWQPGINLTNWIFVPSPSFPGLMQAGGVQNPINSPFKFPLTVRRMLLNGVLSVDT